MVSISPFDFGAGAQHSEVCFVNQRRRFESVIGSLSTHEARGPGSQVSIDQVKQFALCS
jgi:hypothetical protein